VRGKPSDNFTFLEIISPPDFQRLRESKRWIVLPAPNRHIRDVAAPAAKLRPGYEFVDEGFEFEWWHRVLGELRREATMPDF
jgi:hypothetical protein